MFSVGATPYNSAARMRYGGWAVTNNLDVNNPISGNPETDYSNYVALKMAARYDPVKTGQERADYRAASSSIFNYYRALGRYDPNNPGYVAWKNIAKAWRPAKLRRGLSHPQRAAIWRKFFDLPFVTDPTFDQRNTLMAVRQAPYRPLPVREDLGAVLPLEAEVPVHYYAPAGISRARGYVRTVPAGFDEDRWRRALGSAWGGPLPPPLVEPPPLPPGARTEPIGEA